jgi:F-type H+-transporting ATPase subunit b
VFPDQTVFWSIFIILLTGLALNGLIVRPLRRVMERRAGAVKSARALAESAAARAAQAAAEFDARTNAARAEIYREMDEKRRRALERRAELLAKTKAEAEASIADATERLKNDASTARARLEQDASVIANEIVERVLGRRAS